MQGDPHAAFLKPGGLGMLHFIGHLGRRDTEYFIREHVFPSGWIPGLAEVIVALDSPNDDEATTGKDGERTG